jgi:uncharacterized membrane protein YraQ (UPF0718 family)
MFGRSGGQKIESENRVTEWPMWLEYFVFIGFILIGVGSDWYCAFDWFSGKYSPFTMRVLARAALIVLSCACIGLLAVIWRRGRRREGVAFFFLSSITFSGNMLLWRIGHR